MRIVCWQTILMKYHSFFFFRKLRKMSQNLSSAAVVIGALRVNMIPFLICPVAIFKYFHGFTGVAES